jgi:hypothetical protein
MTSKSPDFADTCREVMGRLNAAHALLSSTATDDLTRAQVLCRGLALANIKGAREALDIARRADWNAEAEARLTNAIRPAEEQHRGPGEF